MTTEELLYKLLIEDDYRPMFCYTDKDDPYVLDYLIEDILTTEMKRVIDDTFNSLFIGKIKTLKEFTDPYYFEKIFKNAKRIITDDTTTNGRVLAYAILACLLNWKDLYNICEIQLIQNAKHDLQLNIDLLDIKNMIKYLVLSADNIPEFNEMYENELKKFTLE